jgi:capping protein alpha
MSEEFAQASPEEKLKIASHFILSSPNGEVDEVIADVKTLVGDKNLLSDAVVEKLLRQYNVDNYVFAPLPGGANVRGIRRCEC